MIPNEALIGWSCVCKRCFVIYNGMVKILRNTKQAARNKCVYCGEKVEDAVQKVQD